MAMLGTKLQFICSRLVVGNSCRDIQTNSVLCLPRNRRKIEESLPKKEDMVFTDPGIAYRSAVFKDDKELLQDMAEKDFDLDELESDFSNLDKSYDEMKRERRVEREKKARIVAYKKLFKGPPQPPMLTVQERQLIKHLHEENPQEWDVKRLSQSFPADEEAIKKILRAKYIPKSEERIKEMNALVERNWKLLAQNKLNAPPELIEHWKKFVDRRRNLSAQLRNPEFHKMPMIEPKVKWKSGEMTRILSHYEKQIEELYQRQIEGNTPKEISGGNEVAISKSTLNAKRAILERIEFEKVIQEKKAKETFVVGGDCDTFGESVTLDHLEAQIRQSAKENKELSPFDRMMLEKSSDKYKEGDSFFSESKFLELEGNRRVRSGSVIENIIKDKRREKQERRSAKNYEERFAEKSDESDSRKSKKESKHEKVLASWKKESDTYDPFKEENEFRDVDEEALQGKAIRLTVEDISNALEYEEDGRPKLKVPEVTEVEEEVEVEKKGEKKKKKSIVKSLGTGDNLMKPQIEFSQKATEELDKMFYDKEVEDIEDTCFWNSKSKKKKDAVPTVAGTSKLPSKTEGEDYYPQKIEIPKEYAGSGLTFKVKDCYYDDDGEFLYRVPGMTK